MSHSTAIQRLSPPDNVASDRSVDNESLAREKHVGCDVTSES